LPYSAQPPYNRNQLAFAVFRCIPLSSLSAQASYLHGANSRHETVLLLLFTP